MTALSTWAASTEPKLARIMISTFFLCHRSILLLSSPCYSVLAASPSPIPPFLTQQNKLETRSSDCCCCGDQEFGFFFPSPPISYCKARRCGGGVEQERVRNMKMWQRLRQILLAAILVETWLKRTLLAVPQWQSQPQGQHCGLQDQILLSFNPYCTFPIYFIYLFHSHFIFLVCFYVFC